MSNMSKSLCWLTLCLLMLVAGCKTTNQPKIEWGETYSDVVVPADYTAYDTPPFKRQDGADGKRIFGRYAYKNKLGLDNPKSLAKWFEKELGAKGWEHQVDDMDADAGTLTARYKKGDDQLVLKLAPDQLLNKSDRFSVLTVEMNPPYDN